MEDVLCQQRSFSGARLQFSWCSISCVGARGSGETLTELCRVGAANHQP